MVFNSLGFFLFFSTVLILYSVLPHKYRCFWLLAASYFFYGYANIRAVPLILITTATSYVCALLVERTDSRAKKRLYTVLTTVVCLGILAVFKYADFMVSSVFDILSALNVETQEPVIRLLLPVGISFYTFQTMSYVIDVYRGEIHAEKNFIYYALYVAFFPQLVAGPIERSSALLPQLKEKFHWKRENIADGGKLLVIGFFKKIVIADSAAPYVNAVFNHPETTNPVSVWAAAILFAFQIYGDFSGYTDIARGCARIMGIRLMENFNEPYRAQSMKEFWNRWHISLSLWFRDYLYIPLGGSRVSILRHLINLCVVFIISGLWHGAAWTFVLWGGLHAVYQVIGIFKKKFTNKIYEKAGISQRDGWLPAVRTVLTFLLVVFAWIAFRANNPSDMLCLYSVLFTGSYGIEAFREAWILMGLSPISLAVMILGIAVMLILDRRTAEQKHLPVFGAVWWITCVWMIAASWLGLLESGAVSTFIYFQF